jgi:hypothetical protein
MEKGMEKGKWKRVNGKGQMKKEIRENYLLKLLKRVHSDNRQGSNDY